MSERDLRRRVTKSIAKSGFQAAADITSSLVTYLELLARWNRKINLTALSIDPPNDEALDRLIVEPLIAARFISPDAALMIDVGSGGGSPAIPIRIARPAMRLVLVEAKVRKSAFLQEAARQIGLHETIVETCRFEELLSRPEFHESADVVTLRAVRVEPALLRTTMAFLNEAGRIFLFNSRTKPADIPDSLPNLRLVQHEQLVSSLGSYLDILAKSRPSDPFR